LADAGLASGRLLYFFIIFLFIVFLEFELGGIVVHMDAGS
jgi:hypothetical protein